jgi:hypothetical protein
MYVWRNRTQDRGGFQANFQRGAVFKILSATKLLSIDLYAQTPADERKKSNPRQKLRENHWIEPITRSAYGFWADCPTSAMLICAPTLCSRAV